MNLYNYNSEKNITKYQYYKNRKNIKYFDFYF